MRQIMATIVWLVIVALFGLAGPPGLHFPKIQTIFSQEINVYIQKLSDYHLVFSPSKNVESSLRPRALNWAIQEWAKENPQQVQKIKASLGIVENGNTTFVHIWLEK